MWGHTQRQCQDWQTLLQSWYFKKKKKKRLYVILSLLKDKTKFGEAPCNASPETKDWRVVKPENWVSKLNICTELHHGCMYVLQTLTGKIPYLLMANEGSSKRKVSFVTLAFFLFWISLRVHICRTKNCGVKDCEWETFIETVKSSNPLYSSCFEFP